ncbi:MAG: anti-sigma F factor [Ruminococcaceae bacterium]|nr:anti-sigma F factor [Oscillospiraceae bacterium]
MNIVNELNLSFISKSTNESFARAAVSAFILCLDPTIAQLSDIKTAVSEAVTNCIVHAYPDTVGTIYINVKITDHNKVIVKVRDKGVGIENIEQAMEPLFTTSSQERAGLGFAVMQSFMDNIKVRSKVGTGTSVTMEKTLYHTNYDKR